MQRVDRTRTVPVRRPSTIRRRRKPETFSAHRVTSPSGVATLAQSFGQAIPSVCDLPLAYAHEARAELLYDLCAALVQQGLGTVEAWNSCNQSCLVFAEQAIMRGIGEDRWNLLRRNVEYHLQVSDVADQDGYDVPLGNGRLAVTIECSGSGYLKIGPVIDALEEEAEGLGAAFYWTLTYALYRVMRVYNHSDATEYEERLRESAEYEEGGNEQYEFPEVEKAIPECIRKTHKSDYREETRKARALLRAHFKGRYKSWLERLSRIEKLSRLRSKREYLDESYYDGPPLPSLLIVFKEHDAITACFDEEGQYMLEGSAEPALRVHFTPSKPEEVRVAIQRVERFLAFNYDLFQLVEEFVGWEKHHAVASVDRGEPSLRAA
jgi:hypothetical protein